jgi:type IV pilus assembly protein PilQ
MARTNWQAGVIAYGLAAAAAVVWLLLAAGSAGGAEEPAAAAPLPGEAARPPADAPAKPGDDAPKPAAEAPGPQPAGRPPGAPPPAAEKPSAGIELHTQDEDLATVLELLSRQYQLNIVASKSAKGKVTADLYGVTVEQVLDAICRTNELKWVREGAFVYIHTPAELEALRQAEDRLVTEVFHLNYLTAAEAKKLVAPALSKKGSTAETTASEVGIPAASASAGGDSYGLLDTIVVRDFPENLEQVRGVLKRMDRRPRQVLVEATILAATLNDKTNLGINFNTLAGVDFRDLSVTAHPAPNPTTVPGATTTTINVNNDPTYAHLFTRGFASLGDGLNIGIMTNNVSLFVNALEEVTDTVILSNPKVLTLNKQMAEVNVGDQIGYRGEVTATETSQTQEAEFLDVGTLLRFRPFISDEGYVRLEVHPEVSQRGEETIDGVPSKRTTQVTCNVMIKDGYTLVIGGLFDENAKIERDQVPGLGNVPILNYLFRKKNDSTVRNEIIILLTPHIIEEEQQEANALGEQMRDDAKRRCIGVREGFYAFSRERLTVGRLQDADKAFLQYERTRHQADLDRAWWYTRLALNASPNNLHALRLKDKILSAKDHEARPPRSWTIWDKIGEHIKPHYRTDPRPQPGRPDLQPEPCAPPTVEEGAVPVGAGPPAKDAAAASAEETVTVLVGREDRK